MDNWNIKRTSQQLDLDLIGGGGRSHFDQLCSAEHLFASWQKFARGKRSKRDVQEFERHLEQNIFELQKKLQASQYRHGKYQPFIVHDPKRRQIHKASVQDRLVHQAVFDIIEPMFERSFIYESFSCRKGKGTHAGVRRLQRLLRQASNNNTRTVFALKCDIKQFFASVNHQVLFELMAKKIADEVILVLLEEIINSFSTNPGMGIPLGNLTSQLFANIYMHELDWFVKHQLRQQFYIRYCDDFIILNKDRGHLLKVVEPINHFLGHELGLNLHPDKVVIKSWNQGIAFLGYVLKPNATVLRTKTKQRLITKVNENNLPSYLGLCLHANSYKLRQTILTKVGY